MEPVLSVSVANVNARKIIHDEIVENMHMVKLYDGRNDTATVYLNY